MRTLIVAIVATAVLSSSLSVALVRATDPPDAQAASAETKLLKSIDRRLRELNRQTQTTRTALGAISGKLDTLGDIDRRLTSVLGRSAGDSLTQIVDHLDDIRAAMGTGDAARTVRFFLRHICESTAATAGHPGC